MSPIMIRPVKEQIEHDRVIRTLDNLFRNKYFGVESNPGDDKRASLKVGLQTFHPDLVLSAPTGTRRVLAVVEVESGESVNRMEAMAEWAHFGRTRAPFQLYVPAASADMTRRLIEDGALAVTELWSYVSVGDEIHFHLIAHASKSFHNDVQPGDTMPAMPVYVPPPPPPKPVKVEKPVDKPQELPAPATKSARSAAPPKSATRPSPVQPAGMPPKAKPAGTKTARPVTPRASARPAKVERPVRPAVGKSASRKAAKPAARAPKALKAVRSLKPAKSSRTAARSPKRAVAASRAQKHK